MTDCEINYEMFAKLFDRLERAVLKVEWLLYGVNLGHWESGVIMIEEINLLRSSILPPSMLPPSMTPPAEAPVSPPKLRLVSSNEKPQSMEPG
jgi:hypothetical protein